MSSFDPLQSNDNSLSPTTTSTPQVTTTTTKKDDLFATPFESSVWNDSTDPSISSSDQAPTTTTTTTSTTNLNANAPSFVPSFNITSPSTLHPSSTPESENIESTLTIEPIHIRPSNSTVGRYDDDRDLVEGEMHEGGDSVGSITPTIDDGSRTDQFSLSRDTEPSDVNSDPLDRDEVQDDSNEGVDRNQLIIDDTSSPPPPSTMTPSSDQVDTSSPVQEQPCPSLPSSSSPQQPPLYDRTVLRNLIVQACTTGDLVRLKHLFSSSTTTTTTTSLIKNDGGENTDRGEEEEEEDGTLFALANSTSLHTGLTPVHIASQKGHLEIVKWLIEEAGAIADLEDSDGETALHKASIRGHVEVCQYLIEKGVDVNAQDLDGWTPLHNAASKGSLPILRLLLHSSASISPRSKHGHTPLMNSSSRGDLPSVSFLLKRGADPLLRNEFGETAFDLAAAVFEVKVCQVLMNYEKVSFGVKQKKKGREGEGGGGGKEDSYDLLGLHSTVPIILYENQRWNPPSSISSTTTSILSNFNQTTSTSKSTKEWSSKALSRNDQRSAFTFPRNHGLGASINTTVVVNNGNGSSLNEDGDADELPCFKSEVGLPLVSNPNRLVLPPNRGIRSRGRVINPVTQPSSSSTTPTIPSSSTNARRNKLTRASSSLSRILTSTNDDTTIPSNATTSSSSTNDIPAWIWQSDWTLDLSFSPRSSPHDGWSYSPSFSTPPDSEEWKSEMPSSRRGEGQKKWVRRRKWVRVMRRRVDLDHWGFTDVNGTGSIGESSSVGGGGGKIDCYRERAKFLIDSTESTSSPSLDETSSSDTIMKRKNLARLERAVDELRSGMVVDEDETRKRGAQEDLEKLLERIALLKADMDENDEEQDSDDEFVYNGRDAATGDDDDSRSIFTTYTRPASPTISNDVLGTTPTQSSFQYRSYDSSLSQSTDFRVPTHETVSHLPPPSFLRHASVSSSSASRFRPRWEPDEEAESCRRCETTFTFFKRKHHCRSCGLVVCANCSTHKDLIDSHLVVQDPTDPFSLEDHQPWNVSAAASSYRTCDSCHSTLATTSGGLGSSTSSSSTSASFLSPQHFFPQPHPSSPENTDSVSISDSSTTGELTECPCCGENLDSFGSEPSLREQHVKECLDKGSGSIASGRYLVFNLPRGPLIREECRICFEEFGEGVRCARMVCLCTFHENCIAAWLARGNSCPVHQATI